MKRVTVSLILIITLILIFISCSTVTTVDQIPSDQWIQFDQKTDYHLRQISKTEYYLTVKHHSFTFMDKTSENIPIAISRFRIIATNLAIENGYDMPKYNEDIFYESVGYNGVTGVSTVLVSNDIELTNE